MAPCFRNGTQNPVWVRLFNLELVILQPLPSISRANADKCSNPPILSWQFASCRNISSSLAPCHLPTNLHPTQNKNKVAWPIWSFDHGKKECQSLGVPFGFMNSGVKEKIRFKRLMGVLARLFNPMRLKGSCLINSDSSTNLLLPKQLEIVCSFSSRILSLMMIIQQRCTVTKGRDRYS